jgi:hypothetical protein
MRLMSSRASEQEQDQEQDQERGKEMLAVFNALSPAEQELLSAQSQRLYKRDAKQWREWLSLPVETQLEQARAEQEGLK